MPKNKGKGGKKHKRGKGDGEMIKRELIFKEVERIMTNYRLREEEVCLQIILSGPKVDELAL